MATKRELPQDLSDLSPSPNAKIPPGVISRLSPMKQSDTCSYFDGQITDGKSSMRLFGFDSTARRQLVDFNESKKPVSLSNCTVRRARKGNKLEILVSKDTGILKSEKKLNVDIDAIMEYPTGKIATLEETMQMQQFERVTVSVKVIRVEEAMEIPGGLRKQDVMVGDKSGTVRFTVWESEIGQVQTGCSYKLTGVMVREYRGNKFLSTSKEGSIIEEIDDIGDVVEVEDDATSSSNIRMPSKWMKDARVIGVNYLDKYYRCVKCRGKVNSEGDEEFGQCSKCHMTQCLLGLEMDVSVQLIIKSVNGSVTLRAFGKVIKDIVEKPSTEVTERELLKAKKFDAVYSEGIVQSIVRADKN